MVTRVKFPPINEDNFDPIPWKYLTRYAFINKRGKWDAVNDFAHDMEEIRIIFGNIQQDVAQRGLEMGQWKFAYFERVETK